MLVWGKPVSVEQAKEIIFLTDRVLTSFDTFYGGNDKEWNENVVRWLGYKELTDHCKHLEQLSLAYDRERSLMLWNPIYEASLYLRRKLNAPETDTDYVTNSWASCAYVYGPHGWCHPDGTIGYVDNVGKWPEARSLFDEWSKLAERFPFLDLKVTLMDREHSEENKVPVFSIKVCDGKAELIPTETPQPGDMPAIDRSDSVFMKRLMSRGAEIGLSEDWIFEYAEKYKDVIQEAVAIGKALADEEFKGWKENK